MPLSHLHVARDRSRARCAAAALLLAAALAASAAERPRIGLVLGGGGARGAAHVGVLEVLERLRVPVDCVAGTSMGALVAGAWGAGMDSAQLRRALSEANWSDMFQDNPDWTELNFRNRRLARGFLPGSELGVSAHGLAAPEGLLTGQKIKLFFNQLVGADLGERDLAELPLPVSIVATDIGTGERVVMRSGSLTQAMRASMSVPGLMSPVEIGARKLVDGGLVDNLPIREVRERCGAEVVIAVNVGSPLLKPEAVGSLLTVSTQMVAILTEQNVGLSLATLRPGDIVIKPALDGIGVGDFERHAETADRGRAAAEAASAALQRLGVPPAEYARWRAGRAGVLPARPRVDEIEIVGLERVNPQAILRHLEQPVGQPLDTARLHRDLLRAYGDGHYEAVDYQLLTQRGRNVLRIAPLEKSWGPDYLRLGVNLNASLLQGSTYSLRAALQRTLMNPLGAELLLSAELGTNQGLAAQWYQPVDVAQRWFVQGSAALRRERADLFVGNDRLAEYRVASGSLDLAAGLNLGLLGQARFGWRETRRAVKVEVGQPLLPAESPRFGGWLFELDIDQLNRLYFPTRGWAVAASWFESKSRDYSRAAVELRGAVDLGDFVLGTRLAHTGSPRGTIPAYDAATLGGFLNLSGFAHGQLLGDTVSYAHLRAERIVSRSPLGLRGDLRLGLAYELGRVRGPYTEPRGKGWFDSATIYLGGETPFGPLYVGLGHSSSGSTNAYLFIGTP